MTENYEIQLCFHERKTGSLSATLANYPLKLEFSHYDISGFKDHLVENGIEFDEWSVPWTTQISVSDPFGNILTFSE